MEKHDPVTAIYPGTFDPFTNGHFSLVTRGLSIFDKVIVAVARDPQKKTLFTLEERVEMGREVFRDFPRVLVEGFSGLLVDYARKHGAKVILRGLRAVSDFDYEFQMALMNRKLERCVQTVFLMTDFKWIFMSSTLIKEVACLDGNIKGLVPDAVVPLLYAKCAQKKKQDSGPC
ncbi:MAG: pantetheine-phosphate adenylyltransferase [Thermodesulfobacteriota bacterium]|nr:pantetheine-phosphate adenylyltransferase [Thermodesulfobacteriota bacterium]